MSKKDDGAMMGLDVGGTKLCAIVLDPATQEPLAKTKTPTPDNYEDLLKTITEITHQFETDLNRSVSLGMCYPGSVNSETALVQNANILWLNGQDFEGDLTTATQKEIRTANDANCFTLSEAISGAGKGKQMVFGATLGTGLGGGLVINGEIWKGAHGVAAEWGHCGLPYMTQEEAPGPLCYCGNRGCLESYLSGTGLSRSYEHQTGEKLSGEQIVALSETGDAAAELAMSKFENRLARAIANVINTLDPDIFVLGGGLSRIERLFKNVPALFEPYVFSATEVKTPIVPAAFGTESGMRGAAFLWH